MNQTPLPFKTMLIVCIVIFSEPMMFPFVYFMVKDFNMAEEKDIGFYVGFIAASFSFAQFLTSMLWGAMSDRFGRRPILLIGLMGNTITMLLFGVSKSLFWAISCRLACGCLNGNVGVAKSVLGEITDQTNNVRAFSFLGLVWGPVIGGFLANPTDSFPSLFGGCDFLRLYPYFLPCFFGALVSFVGLIVGYYHLPETAKHLLPYLPVPGEDSQASMVEEEVYIDHVEQTTSTTTPFQPHNILTRSQQSSSANMKCIPTRQSTALEIWDTRTLSIIEEEELNIIDQDDSMGSDSIACIISYGLLAFQNIIFDEVFSLWAVAPIGDGLKFSSNDIGMVLSIMGGLTLIYQMVIYPKLGQIMSIITIHRLCLPLYTVVWGSLPFLTMWVSSPQVNGKVLWLLLIALMGLRTFANVSCFTSINVLISQSAKPGQLGPAIGGILWSWSIQNGWEFPLNGSFVFTLLVLISSITFLQSLTLPQLNPSSDPNNQVELLH
ncbi:hypothetical protein HDV02_004593 [Globomyces sp. JEL0801]|nr:hypothetical protein HDV02_004593 [Globomyces sp. JEL0801]